MTKRIISLVITMVFLLALIPNVQAADTIVIDSQSINTIAAMDFAYYTPANKVPAPVVSSVTFVSRNDGNTLIYDIVVPEGDEGVYEVAAYAGTVAKVDMELYVDDVAQSTITFSNTGNFNTIKRHGGGEVTLESGRHLLKLLFKGGTHYDYMELTLKNDERKQGVYKKHVIPTMIEAEDYDTGAGAYKSADNVNDGGAYRLSDPLDVYASENGYYLQLESLSDYASYTFEVENEGAYTIYCAVEESCDLQLYFDDYPYPVDFKASGVEKETEACSVYLTKGVHKIKVMGSEIARNIKLDYFRFTAQKDGECITLESLKYPQIKQTKAAEEKTHGIYKEYFVAADGSDRGDGSRENPFATIMRAAEQAKKVSASMTGDIIVNIEEGEYYLKDTIVLDETYSGKNGYSIIFRGQDKNNLPVITGGKKVSGWEKHNDVIWKAPLEYDGPVRNFYVNEFAAVRARSKYAYSCDTLYDDPKTSYAYDGFYVNSKNFPNNLSNPEELVLVWDATWAQQRTNVAEVKYSIDEKRHLFIMDQPGFYIATIEQGGTPCGIVEKDEFFIENSMELLDEKGEFYYNQTEKMLYYYPWNGEDLLTADCYVPEKEFILRASGSDYDNKIKNITFENLSFKYGAWKEPADYGTFTIQASSKRSMKELGADGRPIDIAYPFQLEISSADNFNFIGCEFLGHESDILVFKDGVTNSKISGCIFRDSSSGGITIGRNEHSKENPLYRICENIEVSNNVFRRTGCEYPDSLPLTIYYEKNIDVSHNDIYNMPYSGISMGWGWGMYDPPLWGYNNISNNKIGMVMTALNDGGYIYVVGRQRDTHLTGNYTYDPVKSDKSISALYTDQGSHYVQLHHNVLDTEYKETVKWWHTNLASAKKEVYVYENYSTGSPAGGSGNNTSVQLIRSHHYLEKDSWPEEALNIVNNSGLQPQYEYLLEKAEPPFADRPARFRTIPNGNFYKSKNKLIQIIQAEDFNTGENGVAFYDDTGKPSTMTSFIKSNGKMVDNNGEGEWLTYDFEIDEAGDYEFKVLGGQGASIFSGSNVYIDGVPVAERVTIPSDGKWTSIYYVDLATVHLDEGKHTMRYEFVGSGHYVDLFDIRKVGAVETYTNEPQFDEGVIVY